VAAATAVQTVEAVHLMKPETRAAIVLLLPAMALITVFYLVPVLGAVFLSATDYDIYSIGDSANTRFVGTGNYTSLLRNSLFWKALTNTLYFSLVGGPLTIIVALGAALLLNAKLVRFKPFFRTIYFAPVVTTIVAVAIVFRFLYHARVGLLNQILGTIGIAPIDWLGDAGGDHPRGLEELRLRRGDLPGGPAERPRRAV
jgi:multiple sugar transport system permease protein